MNEKLDINRLFNLSELYLPEHFEEIQSPLDLLGTSLTTWINSILNLMGVKDDPIIRENIPDNVHISGRVYISKGAKIEPFSFINGPTYIGPDAEVRHGAYIRGSVYIGKGSVVGHTTEVKNSVFLDEAKASHFAYIGDSILGNKTNLGAGTKLANLKLNRSEVFIKYPMGESETLKKIGTGLKKMGALIGDGAQTGCNSVLSPGSILLPKSVIYPCVHHFGTKD